jgi:hypothetical protein
MAQEASRQADPKLPGDFSDKCSAMPGVMMGNCASARASAAKRTAEGLGPGAFADAVSDPATDMGNCASARASAAKRTAEGLGPGAFTDAISDPATDMHHCTAAQTSRLKRMKLVDHAHPDEIRAQIDFSKLNHDVLASFADYVSTYDESGKTGYGQRIEDGILYLICFDPRCEFKIRADCLSAEVHIAAHIKGEQRALSVHKSLFVRCPAELKSTTGKFVCPVIGCMQTGVNDPSRRRRQDHVCPQLLSNKHFIEKKLL